MARILAEFAACIGAFVAYWLFLYGWLIPTTAISMGIGLPHYVCVVVLHVPALMLLLMAGISALDAVTHKWER